MPETEYSEKARTALGAIRVIVTGEKYQKILEEIENKYEEVTSINAGFDGDISVEGYMREEFLYEKQKQNCITELARVTSVYGLDLIEECLQDMRENDKYRKERPFPTVGPGFP